MKREWVCADAVKWLPQNKGIAPILTGLPDAADLGLSIPDYTGWFCDAVCHVMAAADQVSVFCQTDRRYDGGILSKADLLLRAARTVGRHLHWHKIVMRFPNERMDLYRPGFSHLMAFGTERGKQFKSPDVITPIGAAHDNGMDYRAACFGLDYIREFSDFVCDPFCGIGTTAALADRFGFRKAISVDISQEWLDKAKVFKLERISWGLALWKPPRMSI